MKPLHLTLGHSNQAGSDNGQALALIDMGRMTRVQLNEARKAGGFKDLHRGLIENAFGGRS